MAETQTSPDWSKTNLPIGEPLLCLESSTTTTSPPTCSTPTTPTCSTPGCPTSGRDADWTSPDRHASLPSASTSSSSGSSRASSAARVWIRISAGALPSRSRSSSTTPTRRGMQVELIAGLATVGGDWHTLCPNLPAEWAEIQFLWEAWAQPPARTRHRRHFPRRSRRLLAATAAPP